MKRHCEEAKPTKQSSISPFARSGLLPPSLKLRWTRRFALTAEVLTKAVRNDVFKCMLVLMLITSITACGHRGNLKSPSQIEAEEAKKAREAQEAK